MFTLKVKYTDRDCQDHICGLCGRKLSSKTQEIHVMVDSETDHEAVSDTTVIKNVHLIPRKDWDEDYMEVGDYYLIGSTCHKKIPSEYKEKQ